MVPVVLLSLAAAQPALDPRSTAQALFAADSALGAAPRTEAPSSGLLGALAPGVVMPGPDGRHLRGAAEVAAALRQATEGATAVHWTPVRVALAASGDHGLSYGYQTVYRGDRADRFKYIAYWTRLATRWRIAVYRRTPSAAGDVSLARLPDLLPTAPMSQVDGIAARASLAQVERDFSAEAQRIGLGPAFAKFGRTDAVNMGGPGTAGFVIGAQAIAQAVGGDGGATSPVSWGPDTVLVAASGDLGVTIGVIRTNQPPPDGSPGRFAFFTVWYRPDPGSPWRYLAE